MVKVKYHQNPTTSRVHHEITDIPITLHRCFIRSFWVFVWTDRQRHRDRCR